MGKECGTDVKATERHVGNWGLDPLREKMQDCLMWLAVWACDLLDVPVAGVRH
jgi:hypothetical protein